MLVNRVETNEKRNQSQGPNTIPENKSKGVAGIKNKGLTM